MHNECLSPITIYNIIYELTVCIIVLSYFALHIISSHVLSRYIPRPLLWHQKKLHFRCYSLLRADMSAHLYEKGFIICAGQPYDVPPPSSSTAAELPDLNRHLTNLSINKTATGHPGLVPCLLSEECPTVRIEQKKYTTNSSTFTDD